MAEDPAEMLALMQRIEVKLDRALSVANELQKVVVEVRADRLGPAAWAERTRIVITGTARVATPAVRVEGRHLILDHAAPRGDANV